MLKYFLLWFPMLLIAVINGTARDLWYKKQIGELPGHQVSTISLIILFGFYIWFVIRTFPPESERQSIFIGLLWLILTLIFEFGFGRFRGISWHKLFEEYNILKGRLWVFILIWTTLAPYLFFKITRNQ
ncbi:MAG: hypothetical protein ABI123_07560 [Ginsengibacter sp.]